MERDCKKCPLPNIVKKIERCKITARSANGNVQASTSPTEAEPYQKLATEALKNLKASHRELQTFIEDWGGYCDDCEYGA